MQATTCGRSGATGFTSHVSEQRELILASLGQTPESRIFTASSQADVAEVLKAMQQFDLDDVTLDQSPRQAQRGWTGFTPPPE